MSYLNFVHIMNVAWFTFYQAALSTLLALLIGLPAAFFCGRRSFPGRRFLLSLSIIPFCIPPLIIALGYVTFLGVNGGLNQLLMFVFGLKKPPVRVLYSFIGLIIAHGFYNFPIIMKNVSDAWEHLPQNQSESARLLGAGEGRIFRTVTLYQLLPSITSSSLLVFIYCFLSFILVLLFGGIGNTTLEVEIYKAAKATLNFSQVGILAVFETLILCGITVLYYHLEKKGQRNKGIKLNIKNCRKSIQKSEYFPFLILVILILIFFIAPLAGIIVNAFTSANQSLHATSSSGVKSVFNIFTLSTFRRTVKMRSFWPSVIMTIKIAFCTGTLCMIFGFSYSVFLRFQEQKCECGRNSKRKGFRLSVLNLIPMFPMMISSVVVGVLITILIRKGNVFWLILAQSALNWPLAFKIINPQLSKISKETLESAFILSKNKLQIIYRIIIPVCAPSLLSAFGFCFAVSTGDATLPLVLSIPKLENLALFTYRLAGAYRFNEACAAGVVLGTICALIFALTGNTINKSE